MKRSRIPAGITDGLPLALLLGFALLALSYLRIVGLLNTQAFSGTKLVAQTLTEPLWQTRLGLNIFLFALAQLGTHLAFGGASWLMAVASERAWPRSRPSRRQWIFLWFIASAAWLLVANATLFPRSSIGQPYKVFGALDLYGITPHIALSSGLLVAILVTLGLALLRSVSGRMVALLAGGIGAIILATGFLAQGNAGVAVNPARPNIILLGIDSLRPDMVSAEYTPNMHAFLGRSVTFQDAITPLARTFPSWVSILTGRHPHTTGAFMNLLPPSMIHTGQTLPELLRGSGYRTVYAIDEVRFSNIDASYGFDRAVMPIMGGSDFVLTWFSDTPLSNVLVNTRLGALLLPFQHANRAAFVTYDPDSFVRQVDRALDSSEPLFLALHLTLPHWPFEWADSKLPPPGDTSGMRWKYLNSIHRADRQFGELLQALERKGLLRNALVVALSDHGEAFGAEDGFLAHGLQGLGAEELEPQQIGHGTSVFSPNQYRTVLGFRGFGATGDRLSAPGQWPTPVTLMDIAPTVADLLQVQPADPFDGASLLPLLRGESGATAAFDGRIRFTESEYNPTDLKVEKMTASALAKAAIVYRVDPRTDRLHVRDDMIGTVLATRQFAALLGDSLAAAVPDQDASGQYRFVYIPLRDGDIRHGSTAEQQRLHQALQQRFGIRISGQP